jgi:hypothetical protein
MAVIKCALCEHPVDEAAGVCPKCGWPLHWRSAEPGKPRRSTTTPPPVARPPVAPSATARKLPRTRTRPGWVPVGMIVAAALFAWAAYTRFIPSTAPPPGDGDAGSRFGEPPGGAPAGVTPEDGSALSQERESGGSDGADQQPQRRPPAVDSKEPPATNPEGATSPEEATPSAAWRTADGKLYFGNAPPPGSVKIESFGKPAAPKSTPRPSSGDHQGP